MIFSTFKDPSVGKDVFLVLYYNNYQFSYLFVMVGVCDSKLDST